MRKSIRPNKAVARDAQNDARVNAERYVAPPTPGAIVKASLVIGSPES